MTRSKLWPLALFSLFLLLLSANGLWAQVDVNHASHRELTSLPGVDAYTADRIMSQRPFRNKSQVRAIVGTSCYERIRNEIVARKNAVALVATGPVNINEATRAELLAVKGIGEKTANLILAYRPFWSVEELRDFINKSVHTKIRSLITVQTSHGVVDVNSASANELRAIKGMGPRSVDAILRHRPFQNKVEVRSVIHGSVFTRIREQIVVRPAGGSTDGYGTQGIYDTDSLYDTVGEGESDPYSTTGSDDDYGTTGNDDGYGTTGNDDGYGTTDIEEPNFGGAEKSDVDPYATTGNDGLETASDGYDTW